MINEELIVQYSYGIIEDWSDLVYRIMENNLRGGLTIPLQRPTIIKGLIIK